MDNLETRGAPSDLEIRNAPSDLETAAAAITEMRTTSDTFRTRVEADLRARDERIAALETRLNRPNINTGRAASQDALHARAWAKLLRHGDHTLDNEERQLVGLSVRTTGVLTSSTSDGPDAGFLVPPEFQAELDKNLVLYSPMRTIARVRQASVASVTLPKRTALGSGATWEGENVAEPATSSVYGSQALPIYTMKAYSDVSMQLLEDALFDVAGEVASDLGEQFGVKEGAAFVNGTGSAQPLGVTAATITTTTVAGTAAVTGDELIDFFHSLPSPYAANATWIMNRSTIGAIRKLKNSEGSYLWQGPTGPLSIGVPGELLGRPILEMPDMPSMAASAFPIALGDFKSGYSIFDRVNLNILRDPFSQASTSFVRFHARRRVGGSVTKAEAIRLLQNAAS